MYVATYEGSGRIISNALLHIVYHRLVRYFSYETLMAEEQESVCQLHITSVRGTINQASSLLQSGSPCERYRDSKLLQKIHWHYRIAIICISSLSLHTSILALDSSLNPNKLLTTSLTHLFITSWYTRFASPLDFGSQRNITRRESLKEDHISQTQQKILDQLKRDHHAFYSGT